MTAMYQQQAAKRPSSDLSYSEDMGNSMELSSDNSRRRNRVTDRNNSSRVSTRQFTDWIAEQAQKYSDKELAEVTGLSIRAAQNLRAGKSGGAGVTIANWMMNDVTFAAAHAEFVGLILPGQGEYADAITRAINAYVRMKP